jgi:glucuronokinase
MYRLPEGQVRMVEVARQVGASANFAGSGGAIVGIYRDEAMFQALEKALGAIGCRVIKPFTHESPQ